MQLPVKTITIITIILLIITQSFKMNSVTSQIECVRIENGFITLKIWDTKKGSKYKHDDARKDAVFAILFSGTGNGGNCYPQPPLLIKQSEIDSFKKIKSSFFSKNGKWNSFTKNSNIYSSNPDISDTKNRNVYTISVAKSELRKYLEEQKIITPLNNGF